MGRRSTLGRRASAELAQRVRLALRATRRELARISVTAEAGTIRLAGSVGSFYAKQVAISAARQVAGVTTVIDELDVDEEAEAPPQGFSLASGGR
jgi:osmotically-inducible protein OsmY